MKMHVGVAEIYELAETSNEKPKTLLQILVTVVTFRSDLLIYWCKIKNLMVFGF